MTKQPFPFVTIWHGHVQAKGWFFPFSLYDEASIQQRIISIWTPDVKVYQIEYGYILICEHPFYVNADEAFGTPLCVQGNGLSSTPLISTTANLLQRYQIALVEQGDLKIVDLNNATIKQPHEWLDLSHWKTVQNNQEIKSDVIEVISKKELKDIIATPEPINSLADIFTTQPASRKWQLPNFFQFFYPLFRSLFIKDKEKAEKEITQSKPIAPLTKKQKLSWPPYVSVMLIILIIIVGVIFLGFKNATIPSIISEQNTDTPPTGVNSFSSLLAIVFIFFFVWIIYSFFNLLFPKVGILPTPKPNQHHSSRLSIFQYIRQLFKKNTETQTNQNKSKLVTWFSKLWGGKSSKGSTEDTTRAVEKQRKSKRRLMRGLISRLLKGQQARYMKRMLEMFEDENLENALRYAVPLNTKADGFEKEALGTPDPRKDISINLQSRSRGGSSYDFGEQFYQYLQDIYQNAYEKLLRQGDIEQAAFVLAELLGDISGAIDLFEKNGQIQKAAELAEALGTPEQAIRLWLKLGNKERVISIAKKFDAYQSAISALENKNMKAESFILRDLYAEDLIARGDYEAAVEALWPLLPQSKEWINQLIDKSKPLGKLVNVRMLARQTLFEGEENTILEQYTKLLPIDLEDEAHQAAHLEFVEFLTSLKTKNTEISLSPIASLLLRRSLRYILSVPHSRYWKINKNKLNQWIALTKDQVLRSDVISSGQIASHLTNSLARSNQRDLLPSEIIVDFPEGQSIFDMAKAFDNTFVIALGENGINLIRVNTFGTITIRHFSIPTQKIVISDNGLRALSVYTANTFHVVHVLELDTGRSHFYGNLSLEWFAEQYDGWNWVTYQNRRIQVFDMLQNKPTVVWSVGDLPPQLMWANVIKKTWSFFFPSSPNFKQNTYKIEHWEYQDNGKYLSCRNSYTVNLGEETYFSKNEKRSTILLVKTQDNLKKISRIIATPSYFKKSHFDINLDKIIKYDNYSNHIVDFFAVIENGQPAVQFIDTSTDLTNEISSDNSQAKLAICFRHCVFPRADICQFKISADEELMIWDNKGRVVILDLDSQSLIAKFSA